jgi:hypothetical protein
MLNRSAVVVRPDQPFIDWLAGLGGPTILPSEADEPTVYLVDPFDDAEQGMAVLETVYPRVFDRELYAWHTDKRAWPRRRTFSMFCEWFRFELLAVLEDTCPGEILDESDLDE